MRGGVCRCLAHACQRARVRGLTVRRCASCVRVRFASPHSRGLTRMMGRYSYTYLYTAYTHALPCTPIVVRAYRRGGDAPRTRPGVSVRARSCVCAACEHFPPPPSVGNSARAALPAACEHFPPPSIAFSARRRSTRRRPSPRTSARGTPRESRASSRYAPLPARRTPRRTALGRLPTHARPLCAAAPPMSPLARARVRM
jgi:hypothetical protein